MADLIDILIDNLKETFKSIEKFLLLGLTAGLVMLVLSITNRELTGSQKLMFGDINAPAFLALSVAMVIYFASGAFSTFYFITRRQIVKTLLRHDRKLVKALLTYPSIISKIDAPKIIALVFVGGIGVIALYLCLVPTHETQKLSLLSVLLFFGSPYIVLVGMAFWTSVAEANEVKKIPICEDKAQPSA